MPKRKTANALSLAQKNLIVKRVKKMTSSIANDLEDLGHFPKAVRASLEAVRDIVQNMETNLKREKLRR